MFGVKILNILNVLDETGKIQFNLDQNDKMMANPSTT